MASTKSRSGIAVACIMVALAGEAGAAPAASQKPMDGQAKTLLETALSCAPYSADFKIAEKALAGFGWRAEDGVKPVILLEELKVFGFGTQMISIFRGGGEDIYTAYYPSASQAQLIKAAKLKLGKDKRQYGRLTKLGVLTLGTEGGVATLTCTVDFEGT